MRISYSLLDSWNRGDTERAIATYFHMDMPFPEKTQKRISAGLDIHKEIETYVKENGKFPEWFFKKQLNSPESERKVVAKYSDEFDLSGVFDCLDGDILYEFKTGTTPATEWAQTWQLPIYFLMAELNNIPIETAYIIRWNQYTKKKDFVLVHNNQRARDLARNVVDSVAPDILAFFVKEGLI